MELFFAEEEETKHILVEETKHIRTFVIHGVSALNF